MSDADTRYPDAGPDSVTSIEWGIRDDGRVTPVPDYVIRRGVDPRAWAEHVTAAEGGQVVRRTVTVTPWDSADTPPAQVRRGDRVRCWPGTRDGRSYTATALTDVQHLPNFGSTAVVRVERDSGGTDYLAIAHVAPLDEPTPADA
jgi:hypothetical protein